MLRILNGLWATVLDVLYPPKCPACRSAVAHHGDWCPVCWKELIVPRLLSGRAHHLRYLTECYVICRYQGGLKRVMHDMKFRRARRYAVHLQRLLNAGTEEVKRLQPFYKPDAVLPVPLHPNRLAGRGYDQTELIFRPWVAEKNWPWLSNALVREKDTIAQWRLPLPERRQNIKDAFMITRPELIAGKHILLVDDIFTSGLTMDECAKVLRQAGAVEVRGLALASGSP